MKKIFFILVSVIVITCIHSCKPSGKKLKQTLEKEQGKRIVQHLHGNNQDVRPDYFTVPIGTTHNNIDFKEDGKIYVQLGNSNQTFDITQLHQNYRLCGLKKFWLTAK